MKHLTAFLIFVSTACFASNKVIDQDGGKISNPIDFTENKGQVCDQNYLPRPDVLFSGSDGKLVYHIKNNGISYQLSKIESWKKKDKMENMPIGMSKSLTPDKISIYRIDVSWLNATPHPGIQTEELLSGYNNYYLQHCPDGVFNVQSFKGIILQNLYNGINLHYYEKDGCLKYDFVVSANVDYKKIKLNVEGADISVQDDGSLLLKTPFGDIQEGKPVAFQNGKELDAKWVINGNVLSFEIKNVDPSVELIIDPPTRLWGTYYGGTGSDLAYGTSTDNSGNVFMVGTTPSGTGIATTGSHQTTFGGGSSDGFVAKFNSSGVRQWSTYYGGLGQDIMRGVDTDNSGNVYCAGYTQSSGGSVIATAGSLQFTYAGGWDCFLVKFNSSGIRQWGTYYGAANDDYAWSCDVENSGNIYISGFTTSSGNYFATASAFQPSIAAGTDAFLAKFSPSGTRIWSTYYGDAGTDESYSCISDNKGHVYLSGFTNTVSATLATPGAHQTAFAGGEDAFLVKFDSSGTRLWGTFYGGNALDYGSGCVTDTAGNVYLIGYSGGGAPATAIATPGSHQSSFGGAAYDGFCAKFNPSGVRQWGTFYGGTGLDYAFGCATDISGNIYIGGQTASTTSIASVGAYQTAYGGSTTDGFLAKFDSSGVRQWGTYYGGNLTETVYDCAIDPLNNLFITGVTISTNSVSISSPGSHQPVINGNNDAFLVKFDGCGALPAPGSITGTASFCGSAGSPQTYSIAPVSGASSYNWSFPSGWSGSSTTNSIVINNINTSGYLVVSASNTCGAGPVSALAVTVNPKPVISVTGGTICSGNSFTLTPTGASTYTFSSGSAIVSPTVTTSYSVTGTSTAGCVSSNTAVATITVVPIPSLTMTASSNTICNGYTVTITASGASTYTMFPGGGTGSSQVFYPTTNTTYSVTGNNSANCKATATINISVDPSPVISTTVSSTSICSGQVATITASGASGYTLYPGSITGSSYTVSPVSNTTYSIVGINTVNCSTTQTVGITVNPNPTVTVVSSSSVVCAGQPSTLTASGANTYSWNISATSTFITVYPTVTTSFSVTGTNSFGCSQLCVYTVSVSSCTGINSLNTIGNTNISVFPNPTTGEFTISIGTTDRNLFIEIFNGLGQKIMRERLSELTTKVNLQAQPGGVYFIKVIEGEKQIFSKKLIKD